MKYAENVPHNMTEKGILDHVSFSPIIFTGTAEYRVKKDTLCRMCQAVKKVNLYLPDTLCCLLYLVISAFSFLLSGKRKT